MRVCGGWWSCNWWDFPGAAPPREAPSNHRYVQGQRIYLGEVDPCSRADWILDNSVLGRPRLRRNEHPRPESGASVDRARTRHAPFSERPHLELSDRNRLRA